MTIPDAELLRRYVEEGAQDAFAELVRRHLNLVYFAASRRTGDPHVAEDVTQYVFTALARDAAALSHHAVLTGWLYTTTRFASAKLVRTERRRRAREQEVYIMQELPSSIASPMPESVPNWEQVRPVVDAALDELPDRDREAVLLRFFEGCPFAEIGAALRVTEDAARMRVERALDKLRRLLARRGVTSTAAALGLALANHAVATGTPPAGLAISVTNTALAAATAPAGATAFAGLLGLMSTIKLPVAVGAGVLLAVALGIATREIYSHRHAETTLAVAKRELDDVMARHRDLEGRLQAANQTADDLRRQVEQARVAQAAAASAPAPVESAAATAWDPMEQGTIFMTRHPPVRYALDAYAKARAHFRYSHAYETLGLRPEQLDEFQLLMSRGIGMGATGSEGPYSNRWLSLIAGPMISSGDYDNRMRALIGEDGLRKLVEFKRTEPARELAGKIAGELWTTELPLTPQQADELVRILTENRSRQAAMPGSRIPGYDWNAILTQSGGLLAESQLAVLKGMQARDQFGQAINRTVPASTATGAKPAP